MNYDGFARSRAGHTRLLARVSTSVFALAALAASPAVRAQDAVADFYRGKTMEMIVAATPGNDFDLRGRLLARYMGAHIPGQPTFITRNMPGGGGVIAMNHMAARAARDGRTLHMMFPSVGMLQAIGTPGVDFDVRKFRLIGNTTDSPNVVTSWGPSGFRTFADIKAREIVMGTTAGDSGVYYARALNEVLGAKIKLVSGYPGGAQVNLAMERGEVQGRATNAWASWKSTRPDWIASGQLVTLVQVGVKRHADLPDTPLLHELASNEADRDLLRFLSASVAISRAVVTTPDTPDDRVEALRRAFDRTVASAEFLAETQKLGMDISPMSGEAAQAISDSIVNADATVIARAKAIMEAGAK